MLPVMEAKFHLSKPEAGNYSEIFQSARFAIPCVTIHSIPSRTAYTWVTEMGERLPDHKEHFVFLDGLRGIAALLVGWLHVSEKFSLRYKPTHAYLAVDFFFCLSGFVIAYAYDEKLAARLRFSDFALKRLIRLYPMILFGALLGGAAWLVGKSFGGFGEIVAVTVATLALIPLGLAFHEQAYPPNNPLWSLFFELTANAVYGIERRIFPARKALLAILILSASGIALVAVSYINRGLEFVGFASYSSFLAGFVRVAFPFFAGAFIYRYGLFRLRFRVPSSAVAIALCAMLLAPIVQPQAVGIYDALAVIILCPTIVILGANATHSASWSRIWSFLGKLSYPFYIIHLPIYSAVNQLKRVPHIPTILIHALPVFGLFAAAVSAYYVVILYDEPVRRWLTLRHSAARTPAIG